VENVKFHVLYRSTGPPGSKPRPPFFDKAVCLATLLRAAESAAVPVDFTFINDGPIRPSRETLMRSAGKVISLPGIGNSRSYLKMLSLALTSGWDDDDVVYLVEDDYLHLPAALAKMQLAAELPAASYLSPYDHPDRYTRTDDADGRQTRIYLAGGHHWRTAESSCMTFATRVATLRADHWIHWIGSVTRKSPRDRNIWRASQRIGSYRWLPRAGRRAGRLLTPVPGLATHVEVGRLTPFVDWASVCDDTMIWAAAGGLGLVAENPA
jgi:hypothetical protein